MNCGLLSIYWDRHHKTGIEVYASEIFKRLLPRADDHFFYLGSNVRTSDQESFVPLQSRTKLGELVCELPRLVKQHRMDVFFNPSQYTYWGRRQKSVVSVFDVAWKYFPEYFPPAKRIAFDFLTRRCVKDASRILAISEATKLDLIEHYHCPPDKVQTVPLGVDRTHMNEIPLPVDSEILSRQGLQAGSYILFLGTLQRRKNVENLVHAFDALPDNDLKLVLAGGKGWFSEAILTAIEASPRKHRIVLTGFLPESDKPALYRHCAAFAYPSLYEGFGIPLLEAMACGCACVTSNVSSLPEVLGDTGFLVDPHSVTQLRDALWQAITGNNAELRQRAVERSKLFSWESVANRVDALIHQAGA